MKKTLFVISLLLPASVILFYIWRYVSRSRNFPCPFWLSWFVELDNPLTKSNKARTIIQQSAVLPGMHVIDFGCGPGRLAIPLAEKIGSRGKVTAVDLQPQMLKKVAKKAAEKNLKNIELVQGDIGKGELLLAQCDRALLINVLGEIPNQEAAFKEIFDTLKPGGTLTVTETRFDPHFQSKETVSRLASKTGFREKKYDGNWAAFSLILEKPDFEKCK